jgi:hypothetical protein
MDYIRAMNNYLIPFFGKLMLTNITAQKVAEYESWRNQKMGKVPISSTLANHSSAFNRVIDLAIEQGAISDKIIIPKLSRKGRCGDDLVFCVYWLAQDSCLKSKECSARSGALQTRRLIHKGIGVEPRPSAKVMVFALRTSKISAALMPKAKEIKVFDMSFLPLALGICLRHWRLFHQGIGLLLDRSDRW